MAYWRGFAGGGARNRPSTGHSRKNQHFFQDLRRQIETTAHLIIQNNEKFLRFKMAFRPLFFSRHDLLWPKKNDGLKSIS